MKQANLSLPHIARPASTTQSHPPLLILLHGIGSNEEDLFALAPVLPPQCLVVSVRSRLTLMPGAYAWYHVDFLPDHTMEVDAREEAESRAVVLRFIDEAVAAYDADPSHVYLIGFSQGAIMSLTVMLTHPEKIAGVAAMSGRVLDEVIPQAAPPDKLEGFPVLMAHGVSDEVIPIKYARQSLEYLRTLKVDLFYREYGMGHTISEASLTDMLEWLNGVVPG